MIDDEDTYLYDRLDDELYDDTGEPDWDDEIDCRATHQANTRCPWGCPLWGAGRRRAARLLGQLTRRQRQRDRHRNDKPWIARNERWRLHPEEAPF